MSELFVESGFSEDVAVSPPNLQGVFIPGLDKSDMIDGLGIVTPLGGGPTSRSYLDYGVSAEANTYNTFLSDLTTSLMPSVGGEGISYNLEGLVGPQGPPGPAGPQGLPGTGFSLYSPPNGLFALSSSLQTIEALGTEVDKMIYTSAVTYYYDWTERQPVGSADRGWLRAVSDSDGSNLIVCCNSIGGRVYTSDDYGASWTERRPTGVDSDYNWFACTSDSDGSFLMATYSTGRLYTSDDSGASWTERQPAGDVDKTWAAIASDSDGSFLLAGYDNGRLYISTNSGVNWTETQPVGDTNQYWWRAACDSDGSVVLVIEGGGGLGDLYLSTNSGSSWTKHEPAGAGQKKWYSVACNEDGSHLVACIYGGRIWATSNTGSSWSEIQPKGAANGNWTSVAINNTGSIIMACEVSGYVYTSFDGGSTWRTESPADDPTQGWQSVDMNDAGSRLIACSSGSPGRIYNTGVDKYDPTWSETTITTFARTLVDDYNAAEARGTLGLDTDDSVEFADLTLNTPSNIYALSHDSFADFVADEHVAHSGVTITAGTGLSGGGTIDGNITIDCDITQYTDEFAQDAVGGILDDGTVGNIVFTYDDGGGVISAVTQDGEIDHDSLNNFEANEHIDWTSTSSNLNTSGSITGGSLVIADGGTIGSASDIDVMTIDASGNTTFSIFPITPSAAPDADYEVANKKYVDDNAGVDNYTVKIDAAATAGYIGAASNDGVLRTATGISYTDGGDYVTLGLDIPSLTADGTPDEDADYLLTYDATASAHKKVLPANLMTKVQMVDRGDPAAYDYDLTTFTDDDAWHDLDLSGLVPAGAGWVLLYIAFRTDSAGDRILFRKNGNTNSYSVVAVRMLVGSLLHSPFILVPCDSNRVIEYRITDTVTWVSTNVLHVIGWMLG